MSEATTENDDTTVKVGKGPAKMRAYRVEKGHRLFIGTGRPTALVLDTEHDGNMVALRLRQDGTRPLWVGMKRNTLLQVTGKAQEENGGEKDAKGKEAGT